MATKAAAAKRPSTQQFLDIAEIKEDVVVMKDGTLRAVLLCSSVNFALKSEEEQDAIISAYVGFLNALDYPLQIVVQSRKLDVEEYLNRLSEAQRTQTNELLKAQIADYRQFVFELISLGQIMSKRFFVVVPYDPMSNKRKGFFSRMKETITPALSLRLREEQFLQRRKDLMMRADSVSSNLGSMSVSAALLDTQSLIELYYTAYNPDVADSEKLTDVGKLRIET
ncbi:MAG: TraC family protein [Patescibacteria group bacterium]